MLGSVLIQKPPVASDVRQQHPARATAKRVTHRDELITPAINRTEVTRKRLGDCCGRFAIAAEAREIELVKKRRIERDQLFALQPIDDVTGCLGKIE